MKVRVYFNLHTHKWSIKCMKTGLVIGHAGYVELSNAVPVVSEAGRQRVLKEKVKNVHAYLQGDLWQVAGFKPFKNRQLHIVNCGFGYSAQDLMANDTFQRMREITYNPYKYNTFVDKENTAAEFCGGDVALCTDKRVIAVRASFAQ